MIYEPQEDSFLLESQVRKYAKGKVLDMGTGSGIQALAAARKGNVTNVLGVDIQQNVIDYCKDKIKDKKIKFQQSNLFSKIKKQKFNTITFNPPYLPEDPRIKDITLDGGRKGFEIVEKFLKKAGNYLEDDGVILLLISSLTNQSKVEEILTQNLFEFEILSKKHIFFEDLLVYKIKKNVMTTKLKQKGIKNIKYFTHGHRGLLFTGKYKAKKVTIKTKLPTSKAEKRINNESKWIKLLNKGDIGPKIVMSGNDFLVYEFIEGEFFPEFAKKASAASIKKIIKEVLRQCYILDYLGIDKKEMHKPYKHIIVKGNSATMIDFERAHKAKKPKNVTQFVQYIISSKISHVLKKKLKLDSKIAIDSARKYKDGKIDFEELIKNIL